MLSQSFTPGADLLPKEILRHPFVIDIITKALLKTEGDYIPELSEWPDGTRSDVVLAHNPPTRFVEFQRVVDKTFMQRAMGTAFRRAEGSQSF
ncbi:hypothetical protein BDF20DRAFT_615760 [Mycotypha africana]|uniref:uncharacterized protein n=1 Tax=Mycotypha africana TaxID=64632 RepID=UPI002300E5DE|nr:uncharacterized protein BDF20DRAFT_615760 [Mycotypha africana]KAI8975584.1 hypothetical protein BDF20DRAFT_615760 [Mycotypha africana]